jgi:glycosyltransferase involved in cell wall biosynthesis
MKKLYVVTQSYTENRGSFSGFVEKVSKYFKKRGYEVKIVCGKLKNTEPGFQKTTYAEVIRFNRSNFPLFNSFFNALSLAKNIKKYFRNIDEDIIIANGEAALGLEGKNFFLRAGDQPVLTYLKNMEIAKKEVSFLTRLARLMHIWLLYGIERRYFKWPVGVIYSSDETKQLFEKDYKVKKPYFIPHSGVEPFNVKHINGKKGERVILFVSSGKEKIRKGIIYLEKALPEIFSKYKDVKLLYAGEKFEWNMPDWCKSRIISVGKVRWNEMRKYYAKADFLVSCSLHEMFPNTIIEAMASGLPVVTSDIQGAKEYIVHKKTGLIYERGNVGNLKKELAYLLDNKEDISKMGKLAKKKIKNLYWYKYCRKLFDFVKKTDSGKDLQIDLLNIHKV